MAGQTKEKSVCNGEDMFTMQEVRDERKLTRIREPSGGSDSGLSWIIRTG